MARSVTFASLPAAALGLTLLACSLLPAGAALAQQPPALSSDNLNWVPSGLGALGQQASWHTDFTFDRSMLALASNLTDLDQATRQSVARLNGISVHLFRFPQTGSYNPAAVQAVRAQYDALGWKHLGTSNARPGEADAVAGRTDVWLDTHGVNVAGATILLAGPSNVDLIVVSGDISTLDLLHLRGHFGIPRFPDSAVGH